MRLPGARGTGIFASSLTIGTSTPVGSSHPTLDFFPLWLLLVTLPKKK